MSNIEQPTAPATLQVVRDGRVLRITIANPQRKNAVNYDTMVALGDAFEAVSQDRTVRAIVLTGEGTDFCTGADLSGVVAEAQRGITPEMTMDAANRVVRAIIDAPVPVIARLRKSWSGLIGTAAAIADGGAGDVAVVV